MRATKWDSEWQSLFNHHAILYVIHRNLCLYSLNNPYKILSDKNKKDRFTRYYYYFLFYVNVMTLSEEYKRDKLQVVEKFHYKYIILSL